MDVPWRALERQIAPEDRAASLDAGDRDFSVHELNQLFCDRRPQPGAAVATIRTGVFLGEALPDMTQRFGGDSDAGVADFETQAYRVVRHDDRFHLYGHISGMGELDGVRQEVEQNLAQMMGVADQPERRLWRDTHQQAQVFFVCRGTDPAHRWGEHPVQIEFGLPPDQLAGLDSGEVQHAVDLAQRDLDRFLNNTEQLAVRRV